MNTERLSIMPASLDDAKEVYELRNDLSTVLYLTDPILYSIDLVRHWLQNLPKNSARLILRDIGTNEFIGLFRLDAIDIINRSVQVGLDISQKHRRKGYAQDAYKAVLKYLKDYLSMEVFYMYVVSENIGAIHLYEKLGFKETGRLPGAILRNSTRYDYIIMFRN